MEATGAGGEKKPRRQKAAKGENGERQSWELGCKLSRRAFEVLSCHSIRTGKAKGRIVEDLILRHLPRLVISERAPGEREGDTEAA